MPVSAAPDCRSVAAACDFQGGLCRRETRDEEAQRTLQDLQTLLQIRIVMRQPAAQLDLKDGKDCPADKTRLFTHHNRLLCHSGRGDSAEEIDEAFAGFLEAARLGSGF